MASLLLDHTILKVLLSLFVAFIATYIFVPYVVDAAKAKHLYDLPNGRTSHHTEVPRLGGMAIYAGFLISGMIFINISQISYIQYVISGSIIIFFLGLKDDILSISPLQKLLGQLAAATIVIVLGDVILTSTHGFFGLFELGYTARVFLSLFIIILIINAMNLIDGIDGLAAGIGILVVGFFCIWFFLAGQIDLAVFSAALVGALIAFIRYNVFSKKNKIFMGDIGSLTLGFFIAVLIIRFNEINLDQKVPYAIHSAPSVTLGLLIIPLFDTFRVFIIRIVKGTSPFSADKSHLHHELISLGMSHLQATSALLLANLFFMGLVLILQNYMGMHSLFALVFALASVLSLTLTYFVARKKRHHSENHLKAK